MTTESAVEEPPAIPSAAPLTWDAPGPGLWEREAEHERSPHSPYLLESFLPAFEAAFAAAFRDWGILLDRMDHRLVHGWLYLRPRPVGAPEKPGGLPPAIVFRALLRLHPALRRRVRAARRSLATRAWRGEVDAWEGGLRVRFRRENRALQAVDPATLDDAALCGQIEAARALWVRGLAVHFRHAVAHWIGVGDWLTQTVAWTGTAPSEALAALRGASPASVGPVGLIDRVAAAIRDAPAARAVLLDEAEAADVRLARLRGGAPAVAAALDAYLEEYGYQLVTGYDLSDRTGMELPCMILAGVRARLERDAAAGEASGEATAALRAMVPAERRAEYDALLAEACALYGLRDDDHHLTYVWPVGLLRRALLAAGTRLAARGALHAPEDTFEATHAEVMALLTGAGPPAEELASRAARRRRASQAPAPLRLGEDEGPPPPSAWLPPALARINDALMLALSLESAGAVATAAATEVRGAAASRGRYAGRARLVLGPEDFERLEPGDVLVAPITSPAYNVALPLLGAVVTDSGGALSHPAIVAREYGIPAVVGTHTATREIADGAWVVVDGDRGVVTIG